MRPHFFAQSKLFLIRLAVVISTKSSTWLVGIGPQEIEDGASQFNRIFFQVVKEIRTKLVRMNMAFLSRGDLARKRTQEHAWVEQIPRHFIDIIDVKRAHHSKPHR
jgi:hypothetical protein